MTTVYAQEEFLDIVSQQVTRRKKRELDTVFVIFGPEGSGKSMAGLVLSHYLMEQGINRFNVDIDIVYHAPELLKAYNKGNSTILVDEALNLMYSKEHMGNSYIAKKLFRGRYLLNTLLIVAQNLRWLDPVIREHRARYFILTQYYKGEYRWLGFSHHKAKELYIINRNFGYSKMRKFENKADDIIEDVSIESIEHLIESYKKVKQANDILGDLLDLYGISEQTFAKLFLPLDTAQSKRLRAFIGAYNDLLDGKIPAVLGRENVDDEVLEVLRRRYGKIKVDTLQEGNEYR